MRRTLATWALVVVLGTGAVMAEEGRSIDVAAGVVDAEGTGEEGASYSAGWVEPLGHTGRWSGQVRLERLADLGGELDAYQADVDMLANFGLGKRFRFFLGGGVGSVWQDATETTQVVQVEPVSKHASPSAPPAPVSSLTVDLEDEDAYLRYSAVAGFRVLLDKEQRFGLGLQYRLSQPMGSEPEDSLRDQDQLSLVLSLPTGL